MSQGYNVIQADNQKLLLKFVDFPFQLYKKSNYWVPPMRKAELNAMLPEKNPSLLDSDFSYWLVLKGETVVGRVAGYINWRDNKLRKRSASRFGSIDFVDDPLVCKLLLGQVEDWSSNLGISQVDGPLGPGHFDRNCVLVEGFNELPTVISSYNFPYYPSHIEDCGYTKEVDYLEHRIKISGDPDSRIEKISSYVLKKKNLFLWSAKSKKELIQRGKEFFQLINEAYAGLHDFVPLTDAEIDYLISHFFSFIDKKFVKIVVDENDNMVGAGIAMESYSKAMKACKGKLFPFGWLKVLISMRKNDVLDLCLVAVSSEYRNQGLNSILMHEMHKTAINTGLKWAETNGELETNSEILDMWKGYDFQTHKRRRIYTKKL